MYSSAMLYAAIGFAVNAGGGPSQPAKHRKYFTRAPMQKPDSSSHLDD